MLLQDRSALVISRQVNGLLQRGLLERHRVPLGRTGRPADVLTLVGAPLPPPEHLAALDDRLAALVAGELVEPDDAGWDGDMAEEPANTWTMPAPEIDRWLALGAAEVPATPTIDSPEMPIRVDASLYELLADWPELAEALNTPDTLGIADPALPLLPSESTPLPPAPSPLPHEPATIVLVATPSAPAVQIPPPQTAVEPSAPWLRTFAPTAHAWVSARLSVPKVRRALRVIGLVSAFIACIAAGTAGLWLLLTQLPAAAVSSPTTPVVATPEPATPAGAPTPATRQCATITGTGGAGLVVREAPDGQRLGLLPEGATVEITGAAQTSADPHQTWVPVRRAELAGWASMAYLALRDCEVPR